MSDEARIDRMPCERARRLLKAWLDDELDDELGGGDLDGGGLRDAVGAHVAACPGCREVVADYKAISGALRRAADVLAPEPSLGVLRRRAEEVRRERLALTRSLKRVAAAAALVLVGALGFLASQGSGDALEESRTIERVRYDDAIEIVLSEPSWRLEYR